MFLVELELAWTNMLPLMTLRHLEHSSIPNCGVQPSSKRDRFTEVCQLVRPESIHRDTETYTGELPALPRIPIPPTVADARLACQCREILVRISLKAQILHLNFNNQQLVIA